MGETRWVPCNERMPPPEKEAVCKVQYEQDGPLYNRLLWHRDGEWIDENGSDIEEYCIVVAYLENVPEYQP